MVTEKVTPPRRQVGRPDRQHWKGVKASRPSGHAQGHRWIPATTHALWLEAMRVKLPIRERVGDGWSSTALCAHKSGGQLRYCWLKEREMWKTGHYTIKSFPTVAELLAWLADPEPYPVDNIPYP